MEGLSGPADYPDRPDDLTRSTAKTYIRAIEHARVENRLRTYGDRSVEDLSLTCRVVYDEHAHGGHYVLASCRGYANYDDGTHADWGHSPGFYFVAPGLTVGNARPENRRRDCENAFAAADSDENFATPCEGEAASFRVYSFCPEGADTAPHAYDPKVTIEFLGADGTSTGSSTTLLEDRYSVFPGRAVEQETVTYRRGTYRLTATLPNGAEARFRWPLFEEPSTDTPPVTVLVTPAGGVRIRRVPFPEILSP